MPFIVTLTIIIIIIQLSLLVESRLKCCDDKNFMFAHAQTHCTHIRVNVNYKLEWVYSQHEKSVWTQ